MKVKSLLLAVAAFVALGASAQATISMPDINVTPENVGQLQTIPMTLNMPEGDDFTNIQFHIVFPEGVRPMADQYGLYGDCGNGIALSGRYPAVAFSDNMKEDAMWPEYDIIGANMSKTPSTDNPHEFYLLNIVCEEGAKGQFKVWLKYTKSNDEAVQIGTAVAGEEEGTVVYTDIPAVEGGNIINEMGSAVNDVDVTKAVTSVKYYNAAGMASDTAFDGINIVVTKYADGSQSTAKVVK